VSGSSNRRDGHWEAWQVDGKDASLVRQVARIESAVIRFDSPSAEGEAKTQAGSIGASLLERPEQFGHVPLRKTAAFVLNLEQHSLGAGADALRDGGARPGELVCVLELVFHDRREGLSVGSDHHSVLDRHHAQYDLPRVCL
jgi:hypothetical protein